MKKTTIQIIGGKPEEMRICEHITIIATPEKDPEYCEYTGKMAIQCNICKESYTIHLGAG
ncbi:MAG: hypothetical protein ACFE9L_03305 [Candidatus Hodarchaeota archaeon]